MRHVGCALEGDGLLSEFWTCLAPSERDIWLRMLPASMRARFLRRMLPPTLPPYARVRPWREIARFGANAIGASFLTRHEFGWCSVDGVYRDLDRAVAGRIRQASASIKAAYSYEDGALETFRAAKQRGAKCIYDLPIAYWKAGRQIFLEEAEREPEWAMTLDGLNDSEDKLERKDEEIRQADCIVVASQFTKQTLDLSECQKANINVIPYGAPPPLKDFKPAAGRRPLRVLFVGSLGQRKGTAYLLRACEHLGWHVGLTLIGNEPAAKCLPISAALRRHRWISSCTHADILGEMRNHDVLVFPSLFEGFGLVILEAMSQGMTVITTPNTGGPDVIRDGENGFIVPIRSTDAIAERLEWLIDDRVRLASMREAALNTARAMSWKTYERAIAQVVRSAMD